VRTEQIADTWGLNGVMTLLQESERHHVSIKTAMWWAVRFAVQGLMRLGIIFDIKWVAHLSG
jgi:hypothetical protein